MKRKDLYDDTYALNAESRGDCTFADSDEEINAAYVRAGEVLLFLAVIGVAWMLLR